MYCYFCNRRIKNCCGLRGSADKYETDFEIKINVCFSCEALYGNYSICETCKDYIKLPFNKRTNRYQISSTFDPNVQLLYHCKCSK